MLRQLSIVCVVVSAIGSSVSMHANLIDAAREGDVERFEELLQKKADPNVLYNEEAGLALLHSLAADAGAMDGGEEIVKKLLQYGADPEIQDNQGFTPLHFAIFGNQDNVVSMLLQNGANPNIASDDFNETPLHIAAFNRSEDISKILLENGADPNAENHAGETPLHIAASRGYADIFKLLLQYGANPDLENNSQRTPVGIARDMARQAQDDVARRMGLPELLWVIQRYTLRGDFAAGGIKSIKKKMWEKQQKQQFTEAKMKP